MSTPNLHTINLDFDQMFSKVKADVAPEMCPDLLSDEELEALLETEQ